MAGFINKFLNSMKLNDDEDEFEPDDEFDLDYTDDEPVRRSSARRFAAPADDDIDDDALGLDDDLDDAPAEEFEEPAPAPKPSRPFGRRASNVVPMKNAQRPAASGKTMEVCMIKPNSMNDAKKVCDILLSGRAVVINMEGVNLDMAQRIVDFTSGACYSMNGNLQSISRYIFIVTPSTIDLSGDFAETAGKDEYSL